MTATAYTPALPGHTGTTLAWYLKYKSEGLDAGSLRTLSDTLRRALNEGSEYKPELAERLRSYGEVALADALAAERRLLARSLAEINIVLTPAKQLQLFA